MKKILGLVIVLTLVGAGALFAVDTAAHDVTVTVAAVVEMDLNDPSAISLTTITPGDGNGGLAVIGSTDTTKKLFYTSLVLSGKTRNITAALDAAPIINGFDIALTITPPGVSGAGSSSGLQALSTTAATLVTGITNVATGRGATDGAAMTYTLTNINMANLTVGDTDTVRVTLTMSDEI